MKLNPDLASLKPYTAGQSVPGAIKRSSNENPLGPSAMALQAVRGVLDTAHLYPDRTSTKLRGALAEHWKINPDCILVANGSDEIFYLLAAAWLSPGDNTVCARETFSQYRFATGLSGGKTKEVPLRNGLYDLEAMVSHIDSETRLVFICNPNNPTGTYRSHADITQFLDTIDPGIVVVVDEAYADFAVADDFPDFRSLVTAYPNCVVTRTFSKLYGLGGLRVGYAVGDSELISQTGLASMPFNVNSLGQAAAQAALLDHQHCRRTVDLVRQARVFMTEELTRRGLFHYSSQANFICFDIGREVAPLWEEIARRGIAVRDLASFGLPSMIRYTFGPREDNERLLTILDDLL